MFCKLNPKEKLSEAEKGKVAVYRASVWRHMVNSTEGSSERQKLSPKAEETWSMEKMSVIMQLRKSVIGILVINS